MIQIDPTKPYPPLGGFVAKSLPNLATLHSWAGDVELIVHLTRDQCATLADVLKSRLGNFAIGGAAIKKIDLHNFQNPTL